MFFFNKITKIDIQFVITIRSYVVELEEHAQKIPLVMARDIHIYNIREEKGHIECELNGNIGVARLFCIKERITAARRGLINRRCSKISSAANNWAPMSYLGKFPPFIYSKWIYSIPFISFYERVSYTTTMRERYYVQALCMCRKAIYV